MIFETHAHYEDEQYEQDREELLLKMPSEGVEYIVNVGSSMETSKESIQLARQYEGMYAAAGLHPDYAGEANEENLKLLADWCQEPEVVAVGEIGLDYYYEEPGRKMQQEAFAAQLDLAYEQHMPVIVHSRDAAQDTSNLLKEHHGGAYGGVIHCFSYSVEMAQEFIRMGFYIGVGGVVTFKNAKRLVEVVKAVDLAHIVLETDCPYMAPVPHRGKRNSSLYLPLVAEKIAQIKEIPVEMVYEQTMENAKKLYRL